MSEKNRIRDTEKKPKGEEKSSVFSRYMQLWRKVTKPSGKQWFDTFWKVLLIAVVLGVFFLGFDYAASRVVVGFQNIIQISEGSSMLAIIYTAIIVLVGVVSVASILLQQGSSDGLTSLFGSSIEYGGSSISGLTGKVSTISVVSMALFILLVLFSPIVYGWGAF